MEGTDSQRAQDKNGDIAPWYNRGKCGSCVLQHSGEILPVKIILVKHRAEDRTDDGEGYQIDARKGCQDKVKEVTESQQRLASGRVLLDGVQEHLEHARGLQGRAEHGCADDQGYGRHHAQQASAVDHGVDQRHIGGDTESACHGRQNFFDSLSLDSDGKYRCQEYPDSKDRDRRLAHED